jgi:uncharacterized protein YPO0396
MPPSQISIKARHAPPVPPDNSPAAPVRPITRSTSSTGLVTLAKGLNEHSAHIDEINSTLESVRTIVEQYKLEIELLHSTTAKQDEVIKSQTDELSNAVSVIRTLTDSVFNIING